ncbi:MAG: nuclease [Desulfobacterales bacterium CG23_combo_of_CG06-09_8_20_14_all_52_9]|nr:MAG: nuclease [Desulfobacterales bacterium CG23_combo_of_CG06-09_8_20_14_all_52_9]
MPKVILLDAGPLGMVTHPRQNTDIVEWLKKMLKSGVVILVPEIADYEVRRELIRAKKYKSIKRLDDLKKAIGYLPITTKVMLLAAEFWARARNEGIPTADEKALDADVILAAQAQSYSADGLNPIIATTNVGHLSRFTTSYVWENIE